MKRVVDLINTEDDQERPQARWVRVEEKRPARKKKTKERKARESRKRTIKPERVKKPGGKKPVFSLSVILIILASAVVMAAAGFLWFTLNPKLSLALRIKQEPLELHEEVELNISQAALDTAKRIIPAQFLEGSQEMSQAFKATGVAFEDEKSQGVIRVYNNTNPPTPLTLREDTRFLSSGGAKIFRATEKVILPAPAKQGSKVIASFQDIRVIAQEVGDEYNIGPSKFSVPGLAGTNFYYAVWGESEQSMAGGSRKEVPKISDADMENAKSELYKVIKESVLNAIREKAPAGWSLDERAVLENGFNFACAKPATSTAESGNEDLEFTCSGSLSLKTLAFKQDDLDALALSLFRERIPSGREIRQETLQVSLVPKGAVTQSGRLVISLGAGAKSYEVLNQNVFLNRILGKDRQQIEQIASVDFPAIESIDFKFLPFWIKKAPSDAERVKLRLTF
ncbi:MAG: hypothetical protein PHU56_02795 [Candidatus Pacebacteria bacterium]|nr:hypothetical protein [Candidatus Paceibacterota bacterium]